MKNYFRKYRYPTLAFLVVVLAFAGYRVREARIAKAKAWKEVPVAAGEFRVTVPATGGIQPENRILVMAPVAGRIDDILVDEGKRVKRGETLARMSSTDRAALLDMATSQGKRELRRWEREYLPTPILSPVDGIVIKREVVPGQTIGGQTALFEISDRLVVRAEVDETDIAKIKLGQKVDVKVDAYPDLAVAGEVSGIAHESRLSNSVTTYQVTIVPAQLPEALRSGMTVTVNFVVEAKREAALLPSWVAAGHQNGEVEIFVRGEEGEPMKRKIQVGHSDGRSVEVLGGLGVGDVVMYLPVKFLKEGRFSIFGGKGK